MEFLEGMNFGGGIFAPDPRQKDDTKIRYCHGGIMPQFDTLMMMRNFDALVEFLSMANLTKVTHLSIRD